MPEQWRSIPEWSLYEASDHGRIRSRAKSGDGEPRPLSPYIDGKGYPSVSLGGRARLVHRLVMAAFAGPSDMEVRHLDGNPQNNQLSNLAYCTHAENMRDQVRHGTHRNAKKTECKHGHPFDAENTYVWSGRRICRTCNRARKRAAA